MGSTPLPPRSNRRACVFFFSVNKTIKLTFCYLLCLQSSSSTESDSLPFANENAGTIKQRANRPHPGPEYPNPGTSLVLYQLLAVHSCNLIT